MMVLFGCVPWCYLFHYLFSLMVLSPSDGNAPVDTPGSGEGDREDTSFAADGEVVQQNAPARNLDRLPPGYRFTPQDDELIVFYLRNKLLGLPLPLNKIHDVRLYDHNPKDLAAAHERWEVGKWFFFTPRDRKYPNGSRPSRSAGDGYWKATGADKTIKRNGVLVGWRKALVFYIGRPPKGEKTNWIMHEYRAKDERGPRQFDGTMKLDDWVLCSVHEKSDAHGRRAERLQAQGNKLREGGRKKQAQGEEAKSPPLPPVPQPSENSTNAPVMQQGSCSNDQYYRQFDCRTVYPPHSIVQAERFPEHSWFPHDTFQHWNAHVVLGNQISSAAAVHSSVANHIWPAANELGYPVQGNPPAAAPALDAYGALPDVPADLARMYLMDLKSDPAGYLLSNPLDNGYELDLAYDQSFNYDAMFPSTNAMESSNFSSSWPMAAESFDAALFETGATLEIGATSATRETSGVAASCKDFTSDLVPNISYLTSELNLLADHHDGLDEIHQPDASRKP